MSVDFSHIHLLLTHVPIIGAMAGTALFLFSFFLHTSDVRRSSLIVLVVSALLTVPTFISGVGAQVKLLDLDPAAADLIQRHLGSAELTLWFTVAVGLFATIGLWQWRRQGGGLSRWNTIAILVLSLASVGLLTRTGNTGGEVRHPEVRVETGAADSVIANFEPSPPVFTNLMIASKWWWAFMMASHFLGLTMVVGTIGVYHLRVLGFAKSLPVAPLNKLVPWGLAGIAINIVSGMLAFIGMTSYYTYNAAFFLKMIAFLLALATLTVFYASSTFRDCANVGPGQDAPLRARIIAGTSLVLWLAVIVLGRYIQPYENSIIR